MVVQASRTIPIGTIAATGNPILVVPSTTGASFSSLPTLSKSRNRTARVLRTRPVQIPFFEEDADGVSEIPRAGAFPSRSVAWIAWLVSSISMDRMVVASGLGRAGSSVNPASVETTKELDRIRQTAGAFFGAPVREATQPRLRAGRAPSDSPTRIRGARDTGRPRFASPAVVMRQPP